MHRMAGAARETLQFSDFGQIHLKLSVIVATGDTGVMTLGYIMSDPYMEKIQQSWDEITGMFVLFEDKKPIIEFDTVHHLILAHPAEEYLDGLSDRTRNQTKQQYRKAVSEGAVMVFVRDEVNEVLRSYIFPKAD